MAPRLPGRHRREDVFGVRAGWSGADDQERPPRPLRRHRHRSAALPGAGRGALGTAQIRRIPAGRVPRDSVGGLQRPARRLPLRLGGLGDLLPLSRAPHRIGPPSRPGAGSRPTGRGRDRGGQAVTRLIGAPPDLLQPGDHVSPHPDLITDERDRGPAQRPPTDGPAWLPLGARPARVRGEGRSPEDRTAAAALCRRGDPARGARPARADVAGTGPQPVGRFGDRHSGLLLSLAGGDSTSTTTSSSSNPWTATVGPSHRVSSPPRST